MHLVEVGATRTQHDESLRDAGELLDALGIKVAGEDGGHFDRVMPAPRESEAKAMSTG